MTTLEEGYLREMRDRMRRIETKLVKAMELAGISIGSKPTFRVLDPTGVGELDIPNMECSLKDILDAVPVGCDNWSIYVKHKDLGISFRFDVSHQG